MTAALALDRCVSGATGSGKDYIMNFESYEESGKQFSCPTTIGEVEYQATCMWTSSDPNAIYSRVHAYTSTRPESHYFEGGRGSELIRVEYGEPVAAGVDVWSTRIRNGSTDGRCNDAVIHVCNKK